MISHAKQECYLKINKKKAYFFVFFIKNKSCHFYLFIVIYFVFSIVNILRNCVTYCAKVSALKNRLFEIRILECKKCRAFIGLCKKRRTYRRFCRVNFALHTDLREDVVCSGLSKFSSIYKYQLKQNLKISCTDFIYDPFRNLL